MKTCTKCGKEKPLSAFRKNKNYADGIFCWCRPCAEAYQRERMQKAANREKKQQADRADWKKHREQRTAQKREHYHQDIEASREHKNSWYRSNSEKQQDRIRVTAYGITRQDYDAMLKAQSGVCAICKQPEVSTSSRGDGKTRRLCIDHDHLTGQVRGLLCNRCNNGIGRFADSTERMEAAIEYLKKAAQVRKIVQLELFR